MVQRRPPLRRSNRRTLSQNFIHDAGVVAQMCDLLAGSSLPVLDLGAGAGAITRELVRRGHQVTAVELDPHWASVLRRRFGGSVHVVRADMLGFTFPNEPHNVVSNVPYSITTELLRTLLRQPAWQVAVLMVQWEVARKRAGATMLTAAWWPWYDITLVRRVPAHAFRPRPRVDSGLLRLERRAAALLSDSDRRDYQRFVEVVFTGQGAGLGRILRRHVPRPAMLHWAREHDVDLRGLPRDLSVRQWVALYRAAA
ncbi:MAG TPA: 23S ribosomal RNA methyltransferase Erm [Jiangellaceae bacterium]